MLGINDGLVSLVYGAKANLMEALGCAALDLGDKKQLHYDRFRPFQEIKYICQNAD